MFIERNVFYLKFGASRAAIQLWKDYLSAAHEFDDQIQARLLTDLSGTGYVLVLELTYPTYAELEPSRCRLTQLPSWREFYQKFIPLCERSERTLYKTEVAY
ncbi:hypothetical protein [Larkinella rosea]|uniref:NIPSNAP domain-containing protein n=1 Tax=Larkinella rosea TaxID=2025312 RepID=A0A3P1BMF4_9BACT|nr:hypothetical protein [Larkinella rosea]RRB02241.1 hypothetical protein EHT25_17310 [Larkinella rosea]